MKKMFIKIGFKDVEFLNGFLVYLFLACFLQL